MQSVQKALVCFIFRLQEDEVWGGGQLVQNFAHIRHPLLQGLVVAVASLKDGDKMTRGCDCCMLCSHSPQNSTAGPSNICLKWGKSY